MAAARWFLNGIIFTIATAVAAGTVAVVEGLIPAGADHRPSWLERRVANESLRATIARESKSFVNPLQSTDDNLMAAVRLYASNCAVCHGASDGRPSRLAQGFYIHAPQLAKDGVEDDPEPLTYWKLKHGIRFSAMPSFEKTLSSDDLWRLAMFLKRMNDLPRSVDAEWKKVPTQAPSPVPYPAATS